MKRRTGECGSVAQPLPPTALPRGGSDAHHLSFPAAPAVDPSPPACLVRRHGLVLRLWHWCNALTVFVMLMSGFMIFNAHPRLYWGRYGANPDRSWFEITPGHLRIAGVVLPTPGVLGVTPANGREVAFPPLVTIPRYYDLAGSREWHLAFAWLLVVPGLLFWTWGFVSRHFRRDLVPTGAELKPGRLWSDIKDHARLRFATHGDAGRYNVLQKLAYCLVIFLLLPGITMTGWTLSPGLNAAWPWLLDLFGGRQSARSIHFLCAAGLAGFIVVHLLAVLLAGPFNELRSITTGWYRLPRKREA